jgi:hypothetical protein
MPGAECAVFQRLHPACREKEAAASPHWHVGGVRFEQYVWQFGKDAAGRLGQAIIPHILLVPENAALQMQSSDATLHTIHMEGAATFNLPFPFPNQVVSRTMSSPGLVHLRCNGGHVWMNAEMMVIPDPYYAVTDESGKFEFTDVPPGTYQIVAWHEGWTVTGKERAFDALTEREVQRPIFTEPKTWEKPVTVSENQVSMVNFVISK